LLFEFCTSHSFQLFVGLFSKANTVLRGNVKGEKVSVIPNAVDASYFVPLQPDEGKLTRKRSKHPITFPIVLNEFIFNRSALGF